MTDFRVGDTVLNRIDSLRVIGVIESFSERVPEWAIIRCTDGTKAMSHVCWLARTRRHWWEFWYPALAALDTKRGEASGD